MNYGTIDNANSDDKSFIEINEENLTKKSHRSNKF